MGHSVSSKLRPCQIQLEFEDTTNPKLSDDDRSGPTPSLGLGEERRVQPQQQGDRVCTMQY